jgi:hypothetical protein
VRLIQEIGSYAGLAAIPGLAILSALYFSQARDVRRLRDWAGRAPERSNELAQGGRVLPRPATQAGAAQPVAPAAQPVARPAASAATGAAPATGAATAAGTTAAAASGGGGTATATRPATTPPGTHPPVPRVPVSGQTSVLPPAASSNGRDPWYRRAADRLPAGRYIAIFLVGIAVLGGGIAYGITQLGTSNTAGTSSNTGNIGSGGHGGKAKKKKQKSAPAINPGSVKVTVENGTGVTGLAHSYGTKLQQGGFNVINQLTSTQSGVAESVVEFRPGKSSEAALVRRKLGIAQIQPADSTRLSQSGGADVIVLLGADRANQQTP